MRKIIKENQRFERRPISDDEAREELSDEPYKLELIGLKGAASEAAEGASAEVGAGELTIYDNVNRGARWPGRTSAGAHTCPPPSGSPRSS